MAEGAIDSGQIRIGNESTRTRRRHGRSGDGSDSCARLVRPKPKTTGKLCNKRLSADLASGC